MKAEMDPNKCGIKPAPRKTTRVPHICCPKANREWEALGRARQMGDKYEAERIERGLKERAAALLEQDA